MYRFVLTSTLAFLLAASVTACTDDDSEDAADRTEADELEDRATGGDEDTSPIGPPEPDVPAPPERPEDIDPDDLVPQAEVPEPGDVTLASEPATLVSWDEVDGLVEYEILAAGQVLDTARSSPHVVPGVLDAAEITVEAYEDFGNTALGASSGIEAVEAELLVVEWDLDGPYYVSFSVEGGGNHSQLATSPFPINRFPAEDVSRVRFGPGLTDDPTDEFSLLETPFRDPSHEEYVIELPMP